MNGAIGAAELLSETGLTATQREYVETILEFSRGLLLLINDILVLSKLQSGKITVEDANFDIKATVEGVLRLIQLRLKLQVQHPRPAGHRMLRWTYDTSTSTARNVA
jgi:signal transduction histidine kinase